MAMSAAMTDGAPGHFDALLLLGPTASGKSALAMRLAAQVPLEIVSIDSAQVYRGMDIGTAKPSMQERHAVPHHLLDIRDPSQPYSAAEFVHDATAAIADIRARGRLPLVVGGTMLYAKALRDGLSRLPSADPQLRAQIEARAAALGPVSLMLPMVAVPAELAAAHALLEQELEALREAGIACARPPLGIMVEVPAAALCAERFAAEFYSIGSNDLTQYTMAAARDIGAVAALNDPADAAVMALVACTVEAAAARGVEVSLCGDAAGEPRMTELLLRAGLRSLSMAPGSVAAVKQAIAHIDLGRPR